MMDIVRRLSPIATQACCGVGSNGRC